MRKSLINFNIKRILLYVFLFIVVTIIIPAVLINLGSKADKSGSYSIPKFNIDKKDVIFNDKGEQKIKVFITKEKTIKELSLEDYVRGVVCGEMEATFNIEALKAQAVAARTYAVDHMEVYGGTKCEEANGGNVCDTVHCQVYMNKETIFGRWPKNLSQEYWNKVTEAVNQTIGEVLTYNGKLVMEPLYFAISSGKTENGVDVFNSNEPYLKSVSSPGEETASKYKTYITYKYNELANIINKEYPKAIISPAKLKNQIKILSRNNDSDSVKEVKLGGINITGPKFRSMLNINSSNFIISFNKNNIEITCKGYGHGVGMSQMGANVMAKGGKKYKEILTHYYQGVKIEKLAESK